MRHLNSSQRSGFTIIEIIVVIVVLAILATLAVFGYNAFNRQGRESSLQTNLQAMAAQLGTDKKESGDYPGALEDFNNGEGPTGTDKYDYTYSSNGQNYCLTGTSKTDSSVVFSITQGGTVTEGACTLEAETAANDDDDGLYAGSIPTTEACFAFNSGSKTITDYYDNEGNNGANPACPRNVVIPTTIGGVTVEHAGDHAFYSDGNPTRALTAAKLPSTLKSVGYESFMDNNLTSLTLPSGLETIGWSAFFNNSLVTLNIPVSVTYIDENAFDNGTLTDVYLYASTTFVGFSVFGGATLHYL